MTPRCKTAIRILAVILLSVVTLPRVSAAASDVKPELTVGPYVSYIQYKEPDVAKETGFMLGGFADYSLHFAQGLMLGADGTLAWGQVDYNSNGTGSIDNIDDVMAEVRGTIGYDFTTANQQHRITPYIGIGYRYLLDQVGGKTSTTGALGYDRISQYLYLPVGVKTLCDLNEGWKLGLNLEYDVFLNGTQKSELGDAVAGLDTLENDQDKGFGVRGSVKLAKDFQTINLSLEPFVRYWHISQSDIKAVTFGGTPIGVVGYEPKNHSFESGVKVGVNF